MIESIINQIATNPIYFAVASVFILLILYGLIKKLIKLVIIGVVVFAIWIAYIIFSGKEIPTTIQETKENIWKTIEEGKQKGEELLEKKVSEQIEKIFDSE